MRPPRIEHGYVLPAEQFLARLDDEIYRAERYSIPLCLLVAQLPADAVDVARRIVDFAASLRRIDLLMIQPALCRVCLPHTDRSGAEYVRRRLQQALPEADVSIVAFPDDGHSSGQLL